MGKYKVDYRLADFLCGGSCLIRLISSTKATNEVVSYYAAMYKAEDVVRKAIKDSKKGKELSICGFIARSQVRLVSIFPKKFVMATWIRQQKLKKKYKNK